MEPGDEARPVGIQVTGTGLAHGAAGIALALARLYAATGRERWRRAAQAALARERSVFDPVARNWPDLRASRLAHGPGSLVGWCGGAPGIALSRLDCLAIDLGAPNDVTAGLATTVAAPLGVRDHVCCGNVGRVEILYELGRRLNRPDIVATAQHRAGMLADRAEEAGTFRLVSDPAIQVCASRLSPGAQRNRLRTAPAGGAGGPAVRTHVVLERWIGKT